MLREAGFKMSTLTNSPGDVAEAQLRNAGIREFFEEVISADEVKRLKPAPEPHHHAARRIGRRARRDETHRRPHAWDIDGALAAGGLGAFVARPGAVLNPATPAPSTSPGPTWGTVAAQILGSDA